MVYNHARGPVVEKYEHFSATPEVGPPEDETRA
jgi:hypothetical protein